MKFDDKKLIIFDLDGTLIDSVPDLALSVNHTLATLGKDTFDENIIRKWVGNGAVTLVDRALSGEVKIKNNLDEELSKKALAIFLDFYAQNLTTSTNLYPNVKKTLISLKNKKYTLAIVTNKPFDFIDPILKALELDELFDCCLGGDSLLVKKPDPKPLLYVCEKFNIDIKDSIMIGDSKNDILAATNAQMDSIALSYGYNYDEDIKIYNPNIVFDDFANIDKVL